MVLVTLDTTRADHLGCYGFQEAVTPALDAFAREAVLFEQAHATAPVTLPSHTSMFTGEYPPLHGVRYNGMFHVAEKTVLLAERLRAKIAEQLLPRVRESLRAGRSASFGPITMTREGLTWRNTTVAWKDIGMVDVDEGWVSAKRHGIRWLSVQAAEVENLHLLLVLARERDFAN